MPALVQPAIAPERITDAAAREALLDRALGDDRRLKPSERLREGRRPADGLALAARAGGRLVGTVRLWPVSAGGRPALLLGPLGVEPALQGAGIGSALMRTAIARAAALGHRAILLVGDPGYYRRFGFDAAVTGGLAMPGPADPTRLLGLELVPGALAGAAGPVLAAGAPARLDRARRTGTMRRPALAA